jgi:hypothetical protein
MESTRSTGPGRRNCSNSLGIDDETEANILLTLWVPRRRRGKYVEEEEEEEEEDIMGNFVNVIEERAAEDEAAAIGEAKDQAD